MSIKANFILSVVTATFLATGCTTTSTNSTGVTSSKSISNVSVQHETSQHKSSSTVVQTASDGSFSLPNAKSGTCYGKVIIPEQYKTVTEKVLVAPAHTKLTIIPATYKTETKRIVDVPESKKIITIPATYKTESHKVVVSPAYTEWRTGLYPEARIVSSAVLASAKASGVNLEDAKPGTCYYEFYAPPAFKTTTEKVLSTPATKRIIAEPAAFKTVTKRVLVTPASTKLVKVPAEYKTVKERVLVTPASKVWKETKCQDKDCTVEEMMCLVDIPAVYKTVTKQVLVKPETTKTITIPAVYKTVKSTELAKEASTKTVEVPPTYKTVEKTTKVSDAKYIWSDSMMEKPGMSRTTSVICKVAVPEVTKVVTKQVIATPATTKTVTIPATYKTVKVTKLVSPERTKKTVIPATYKNITKQVKVSDQSVKWMPVLCKSSMTVETISKIQRALTAAGFKTPVTGSLDEATKASIKAYQTKKGLTVSGLSIDTLKDLGVL